MNDSCTANRPIDGCSAMQVMPDRRESMNPPRHRLSILREDGRPRGIGRTPPIFDPDSRLKIELASGRLDLLPGNALEVAQDNPVLAVSRYRTGTNRTRDKTGTRANLLSS